MAHFEVTRPTAVVFCLVYFTVLAFLVLLSGSDVSAVLIAQKVRQCALYVLIGPFPLRTVVANATFSDAVWGGSRYSDCNVLRDLRVCTWFRLGGLSGHAGTGLFADVGQPIDGSGGLFCAAWCPAGV